MNDFIFRKTKKGTDDAAGASASSQGKSGLAVTPLTVDPNLGLQEAMLRHHSRYHHGSKGCHQQEKAGCRMWRKTSGGSGCRCFESRYRPFLWHQKASHAKQNTPHATWNMTVLRDFAVLRKTISAAVTYRKPGASSVKSNATSNGKGR